MLLTGSNSPLFRYTLCSDLLGTRVLKTDPIGWDEVGISVHRDTIRHGLTTEYSVDLAFVKDGRAYLQRIYEAAGIEVDVRLIIEQYDPNEFAWLPYYRGRVNMSTRELTDLEFRVNIENENFTQKFLNRNSVQVDLLSGTSVSGSAGPIAPLTTVELHSRQVVKRYEATQTASVDLQQGSMGGDEDDPSREQILYFGFDTPKANEFGLGAVNGGFVMGSAYDAVPIYIAKENGTFVIDLSLMLQIHASVDAGPDFEKVDAVCHFRINGDPTTATRLQPDISVGGLTGTYDGTIQVSNFSRTVNLNIGDQVFLYSTYYVHEVGGLGTGIRYRATITATMQPGSYLRMRAQTTTPATSCVGLMVYEALDRMCQALTDEPNSFRSTYFGRTDTRVPQPFDGLGALTMVTGGFQLRGFPLPSAPAPVPPAKDTRKSIYATWQDLFGSLSAAHWLGYGLETNERGRPVVRVEPAPYFYPDRVVLDLTVGKPGELASTFSVTSKELADRYYQTLEFGYEAWQAEQLNGLDEANTKRKWTTPITQVDGAYTQISKYATSAQLLELTRRQRYVDSDSTDTRSDNDNFLVCLLRRPDGTFETERNQWFSVLDGVNDPASIYNARVTPARMLRNHGAAIRAGLEADPSGYVRFSFGEGNNELVSRMLTETAPVAEKANIRVSELAAPLWRNYSDTFTAPMTRKQLQTLLSDSLGRIRYYNTRRQLCEGWILDFKHEGKEQTGSFTLLPCVMLSQGR
jgi:hypothetical protein